MAIIVKKGHRGSYVADIQIQLNNESRFGASLYPTLVEDGKFGSLTKKRVEEWQGFNRLKVDGIVGPNTWNAMFGGPMPFHVKSAIEASKKALDAAVTEGTLNAEFRARAMGFKPMVLYLHGYDAPGAMQGFGHLNGKDSHHIKVRRGELMSFLFDAMHYLLENERSLSDLVINMHGYGSGTIKVGKHGEKLANFGGALEMLKTYVRPGAQMWIYACCFAIHEEPKNRADADIVTPDEINPPDVDLKDNLGLRSAKHIARLTGMTVNAGFSVQYGMSGEFVGPWIKVSPQGHVQHMKGRTISDREKFSRLVSLWGTPIDFVAEKLGY